MRSLKDHSRGLAGQAPRVIAAASAVVAAALMLVDATPALATETQAGRLASGLTRLGYTCDPVSALKNGFQQTGCYKGKERVIVTAYLNAAGWNLWMPTYCQAIAAQGAAMRAISDGRTWIVNTDTPASRRSIQQAVGGSVRKVCP